MSCCQPRMSTEQNTVPSTISSDTAVVHTQYDMDNVPTVPGPGWTRFICISDTHSRTFQIPPGDVLLHGGDLTQTGTFKQFESTVNWLKGLPHPKKIIIAGNHDLSLDHHDEWYDTHYQRWHGQEKEDVQAIRELLVGREAKASGLVYLQEEVFQFRTKENGRLWSVYGSPWSPYFAGWGFNYRRNEAQRFVSAIPKSDIILTHGPPFGIFDRVTAGDRVGCEALADRLVELRPRLHVFGHIHEDHGAVVHEWPSHEHDISSGAMTVDGEVRTVFVNAANWPMGPKACPQASEQSSEWVHTLLSLWI
ncbi:unnamed protein product [Somion occarium]|uniref:Calcineurin-like phosphoesterase domain-containing protein n=1 Tax=Somion occarium TaxID=3059160 RepID=A0ABP1CWA2_9APHY